MHFAAAFVVNRRKVKYASEMPIFKIAFAREVIKTKKALKASYDR